MHPPTSSMTAMSTNRATSGPSAASRRPTTGRSAADSSAKSLPAAARTTATLSALLVLVAAASGCSKGPAAPFDTLKGSNVTAFRLQNYELPPQQAATPGAAGGLIPGLPPEIQTWVQQGAQGLSQLLPPGLLPPGMVGGAAPAPQPDAPRFHGFRILSQTQVFDSDLQEQLAEILGEPDNFHNKHSACAYSEMGLSFSPQPGVTNDLLISFSCNQIVAQTFAWPHGTAGMKPATVKSLSEVVQKIWPPGT